MDNLKDFNVLGTLPFSEKVRESDLMHYSPCTSDENFRSVIEEIAEKIKNSING